MAKSTIERKVARTILQEPIRLVIDGVDYEAAPPTVATLIKVSGLLPELPPIHLDAPNILAETLRVAKDCSAVGDIAAVLILGSKGLIQEQTVIEKKYFGLLRRRRTVRVDKQRELAAKLLEDLSPSKLNQVITDLLIRLEVSDFFGFTGSLSEINLTKPTREPGTTASGQS